jgi:molybdopterin-guanine dinucleotide biosynthesis protein A
MPLAINQEQSDILSKFLKARFRIQDNWAYYLNQHGRNFVFANTSYNMDPPPSWAPGCCMCEGKPAGHTQFTQEHDVSASDSHFEEEVMFAATPDSNSFQHWRDRTALMLTQAEHLLKPHTKFIAARPKDHTVVAHWQLIRNVTSSEIISPGPVNARKFIYSCDTPLLHPYLVQRMSENMLAAAGVDPQGVPWDERKVVLLIGRNKDAGVHNGHERHWNNYEQCKPQLEALLQRRGQGAVLVEWDLDSFEPLQDIMKFWNTQVRSVKFLA